MRGVGRVGVGGVVMERRGGSGLALATKGAPQSVVCLGGKINHP